MSVQEAANRLVGKSLIKWLILGVCILLFRLLRWGGLPGLVGIVVGSPTTSICETREV